MKKLLPKQKKYKGFIDRDAYRELDLYIDNDFETYKRKEWLIKNYIKKMNKNKFDFAKAEKGVFNNIVVPSARKYDKEFGSGTKSIFGRREREATARSQLRQIVRGILNKEYTEDMYK